MFKKLKSLVLDDTIYMAILLVLVGVGSFGMGRMSQTPTKTEILPIAQTFTQPKPAVSTTTTKTEAAVNPMPLLLVSSNSEEKYVASKSGTKYHALTCAGAKQIKDTNKIYFSSEDEAQAAGYTRAANCKF